MSSKTSLISTLFFTTAFAQSTTTLTVPLYGLDATQAIAASVVSASPNATTYFLGCVESPSDPNACVGFAYSRTLITGPSTYLLEISESDLSSIQDCTASTSYAVCENFASSGSAYYIVGEATYPAESITSFTIPVTDGVEKLAQATAPSESGSESATARQTGASPAMTTGAPAATTPSEEQSATMTGEAASESSADAAGTRGVTKYASTVTALYGLMLMWL